MTEVVTEGRCDRGGWSPKDPNRAPEEQIETFHEITYCRRIG